jgi:hypothetical protein
MFGINEFIEKGFPLFFNTSIYHFLYGRTTKKSAPTNSAINNVIKEIAFSSGFHGIAIL